MSDRSQPPRKSVLELVPRGAVLRGVAKTGGKALAPCPCCRGVGIVTLDTRTEPPGTRTHDDPDPEAA